MHIPEKTQNSLFVQYDLVSTREQLRILLFWKVLRKNNVSLQCHSITSKLYSCSDPLLLPKFIKLRGASIMASTISLHTPVKINTF